MEKVSRFSDLGKKVYLGLFGVVFFIAGFGGLIWNCFGEVFELEEQMLLTQKCSVIGNSQCFWNRVGEEFILDLSSVDGNQMLMVDLVILEGIDGNFEVSLSVQVRTRSDVIGYEEIHQSLLCEEGRCTNINLFSITNTNETEYSALITSNSILPGNSVEIQVSYINSRFTILSQCTLVCLLSINLFYFFRFLNSWKSIKSNNEEFNSFRFLAINASMILFDIGLLIDWRLLIIKDSIEIRSLCKSQFILMIFWLLSSYLLSLNENKYQKLLYTVESLLIYFISIVFYRFLSIKLRESQDPFYYFKSKTQSKSEELSALQTMLNLKLIWKFYLFFNTFHSLNLETQLKKLSFTIYLIFHLTAFSFLLKETNSFSPYLTKSSFLITTSLHLILFSILYQISSNSNQPSKKSPDHLN